MAPAGPTPSASAAGRPRHVGRLRDLPRHRPGRLRGCPRRLGPAAPGRRHRHRPGRHHPQEQPRRRSRGSTPGRPSPTPARRKPGRWTVGRVLELGRVRVAAGKASAAVVHGVTGLGRGQPTRGGSWSWRGATLEDRERLALRRRCDAGGRRLPGAEGFGALDPGAVRNAVVHLRGVKAASRAAATRRFAARPVEAIPLLLT